MSLFNLPSAPVPLADTGAVSYRQVDLSTALNVTKWTQNQHVFRWAMDGNTWWIPQRSYLRIRAKFSRNYINSADDIDADTRVAGLGTIVEGDGVAPVYGFCSALFQSMQHDMSGSTVSSISNYVPQIDTLRYRTSKNEAWRRTLGASSNCYESFGKRQQKILRNSQSRDSAPEYVTFRKIDIMDSKDDGVLFPFDNQTHMTVSPSDYTYRGDTKMTAGESSDYPAGAPTGDLARSCSLVRLSRGAAFDVGVDVSWRRLRLNGRLEVGDWITFVYGSNALVFSLGAGVAAADEPITISPLVRLTSNVNNAFNVRTQVIAISNNKLYVYPAIPNAARSGFFDFVIEHVIKKHETMSSSEVEFLWSPPLSLWQDVTHAIPSSVHELRLTANNNYLQDCIEVLNVGNEHKFQVDIVDFKLFLGCVDGPPVGMDEKQSYVLNMADWQLNMSQVNPTPNISMRLSTFDVSPSATQLAFAFQRQEISSSASSVSEFTSLNNEAQTGLSRFYIQYAGQQRPTPDSDSSMIQYTSEADNQEQDRRNVDFSTQRWWETIINTNQLYSPGGTETRIQWFNLGPYYYFAWPKNPSDISTRVSIQYMMANPTDALNLLLFSRSNTAHQISLANGRVISVQTEIVFGSPSMVAPQAGSGMSGGSRSMMYRY